MSLQNIWKSFIQLITISILLSQLSAAQLVHLHNQSRISCETGSSRFSFQESCRTQEILFIGVRQESMLGSLFFLVFINYFYAGLLPKSVEFPRFNTHDRNLLLNTNVVVIRLLLQMLPVCIVSKARQQKLQHYSFGNCCACFKPAVFGNDALCIVCECMIYFTQLIPVSVYTKLFPRTLYNISIGTML